MRYKALSKSSLRVVIVAGIFAKILFFTHMTNYWTVFAIGLQQFAGVVLHKLGWKPGKEGTCHSSSLG